MSAVFRANYTNAAEKMVFAADKLETDRYDNELDLHNINCGYEQIEFSTNCDCLGPKIQDALIAWLRWEAATACVPEHSHKALTVADAILGGQ